MEKTDPAALVARLRKTHKKFVPTLPQSDCECGEPWPCDSAQAADALDAALREHEQAVLAWREAEHSRRALAEVVLAWREHDYRCDSFHCDCDREGIPNLKEHMLALARAAVGGTEGTPS